MKALYVFESVSLQEQLNDPSTTLKLRDSFLSIMLFHFPLSLKNLCKIFKFKYSDSDSGVTKIALAQFFTAVCKSLFFF